VLRSTSHHPRRRKLVWHYRFDRWVADSRIPRWLGSPWAQHALDWWDRVYPLARRRHQFLPHEGPRSLDIPELPPELRGSAGIARDPEAATAKIEADGQDAFFMKVHFEAFAYLRRHQWRLLLDLTRWGQRAQKAIVDLPYRRSEITVSEDLDPSRLTAMVKDRAAEIGISAVGVAEIDPTVMFADPSTADREFDETRVVVCMLEQNWEATQTIPSHQGEQAEYSSIFRLQELSGQLASYLLDLGYTARVDFPRFGYTIPFGVEAGLGQLGLNGQLLTPFAGSRTRMNIIMTNAPLVLDKPKDYGIPAICDECQLCVKNCPSRAIRSKRDWHDGVYKAAIKPERCFPVVASVDGCGICQKVCPIQRYGLPAVIEEYKKSGQILGKGSEELEGYYWPPDGNYYGPSAAPKPDESMLHPKGFVMDISRRKLDDSVDHDEFARRMLTIGSQGSK
jgi:epoxyqueuosine reductase